MSRHTNKQNGLSTQISKKPYDCMYDKKKTIKSPSEKELVDKYKIDVLNQLTDEVLETVPDSESWLLLSKALEYLGKRRKSSEVAASKDTSYYEIFQH